jgi:hypothetical protein
MQRSAPTMPAKSGGNVRRVIRRKRSIEARKSSGLTSLPSEKRTPGRSVKT